jgi:hypothetical protein
LYVFDKTCISQGSPIEAGRQLGRHSIINTFIFISSVKVVRAEGTRVYWRIGEWGKMS